MPRYDGMDELLKQVRQSLDDAPADEQQPLPRLSIVPDAIPRTETYAEGLELLLRMLRDGSEVRSTLAPERLDDLSDEEHDELVTLLGKLLAELRACQAAIERAPRQP